MRRVFIRKVRAEAVSPLLSLLQGHEPSSALWDLAAAAVAPPGPWSGSPMGASHCRFMPS